MTALSAYLSQKPVNLDVVTDSQVARVLFEGTKAVGVEILHGTKRRFIYNGFDCGPLRVLLFFWIVEGS